MKIISAAGFVSVRSRKKQKKQVFFAQKDVDEFERWILFVLGYRSDKFGPFQG